MFPNIRRERFSVVPAIALLLATPVFAQDTPEMRQILSRLEHLEKVNQELLEEVVELRKQVAGISGAPTAAPASACPDPTTCAPLEKMQERAAVDDTRITDLAQTKVEASQKLPIRITGMALFNAFINGRENGGADNPTVASLMPGTNTGGATLRQSTLGLEFQGSRTIWGARPSGSLMMDFFGGSTASLNHLFRVRTADITLDWKNQSVSVGQEKPLISPRNPDSLAQVGVPALSEAGNLWIWQPQVRFEQRASLGESSGLVAQAAIIQTSLLGTAGDYSGYPSNGNGPERDRPGIEGRLEFWRRWSDEGRFEFAPGFHYSRAYVYDDPVPSKVFSLDWLVRPVRQVEFKGEFFHGQNVAPLGALQQGYTILYRPYRIFAVHSTGGWAQLQYSPTERLSFHLYGGEQDDRNRELIAGNVGKNLAYALNAMYRIAPNVILGVEGSRIRTAYLSQGLRFNNHYDVALAYLF